MFYFRSGEISFTIKCIITIIAGESVYILECSKISVTVELVVTVITGKVLMCSKIGLTITCVITVIAGEYFIFRVFKNLFY